MKKSLTIVQSNPTSNGSFCNKLVAKTTSTVQTPLGVVSSERTETYYVFTDQQNPVNTQIELDFTPFDIVIKPYTSPEGETMDLKYLYPKR